MKKLKLFSSLIICLLLINLSNGITTFAFETNSTNNISQKDYAYQIVKELSDDKYKGRLSGTPEYNNAALYLSNVFKSLNLSQVDGVSNYLQSYSVPLAQLNSMPTLNINGTNLTIFKDFKLHGNTPSGIIDTNQTVFVGYGYNDDYNNIDVKGKNVLFIGDIKQNQSLGILDRINIAASKGAISTLIIPNKYMPISTLEKPIKYDQGSIPCIYITNDVAKNLISINTDKDSIGKQSNSNIKINVNINRNPQTISYNVLGLINGKDTSKTIVVSSSLDGYGYLPDGRILNSASSDASGVGVMSSIAKYYSQNQPNYNIIFAAFGNQTSLREGSKYFISNYKNLNNIITDIDIYDVGNPGDKTKIFDSIGQQYKDLYNTIKKSSDNIILDTSENVNYPFGNNYEFSTQNIPNVFIRFGENLDSLNDKINNINIEALDKTINHTINIINNYPVNTFINTTNLNKFESNQEYIPSINKTLKTYETNHIKFYYDNNFEEAIKEIINDSKTPDQIFEEDEWWNNNPKLPSEKLKVYCVNQWDEGWKVTNRLDKQGTGEQSGGYQSFTDFSLSIVRLNKISNKSEIYGTIAHEFNHICANYNNLKFGTNVDNQEINGHVYAFQMGTYNLKVAFKTELASNILSNKSLFVNENTWNEYTGNSNYLNNSGNIYQQMNDHYNKLACVEYYIWQKYGKEKCRTIQYDFYADPRPSVKSVIEKELNISFNQLLSDCFDWYAN